MQVIVECNKISIWSSHIIIVYDYIAAKADIAIPSFYYYSYYYPKLKTISNKF